MKRKTSFVVMLDSLTANQIELLLAHNQISKLLGFNQNKKSNWKVKLDKQRNLLYGASINGEFDMPAYLNFIEIDFNNIEWHGCKYIKSLEKKIAKTYAFV